MNSRKRLFTGLLVNLSILTLAACVNPAAETYQKGVEGGEKAIDKARGVQQTVDNTKSMIEQQEKSLEGTPKTP